MRKINIKINIKNDILTKKKIQVYLSEIIEIEISVGT